MKAHYSYEKYYDKVLGCFMGKCICGTMGAPYEGMKQILNLEYEKVMTQKMIPNDDLDIQLIWLEVLEKYGENISSMDLAEAFYWGYPHCPGEYAYFKKNYDRRIFPPASGSFCNSFYENGMGSPIRSEIWACVNPASPASAAKMAEMDGCLDHKHDSIVAERYLAALQAMAFEEVDIYTLLENSKEYLKESHKLERLYSDVSAYYQSGFDMYQIRELIIREYGHPDCTNLYQNIGIIWSALFLGKGDIIKTTMLAINCGFDTDCTAATVGAVLGLILGGKKLQEIFEVSEVCYIAESDVNRKDNKISTLTGDIARVGCYFSDRKLLDIEIIHPCMEMLHPVSRNYTYDIRYWGEPVLQQENKISVFLRNVSGQKRICNISSEEKSGYQVLIPSVAELEIRDSVELPITIITDRVDKADNVYQETEIFTIYITDGTDKLKIEFGLCRGTEYRVYGPYWENNVTIPQLRNDESYYKYLGDEDEIREYHLNMVCDFDKAYIPEENYRERQECRAFYKDIKLVNSYFRVSDLFGFEGPCVAYLEREIYCYEEKKCMLYVGKSDKIKVWLNDALLLQDEKIGYCTCENRHILSIHLNRGWNHLLVKVARSSHEAVFSLLFLEKGEVMSFPKQLLI